MGTYWNYTCGSEVIVQLRIRESRGVVMTHHYQANRFPAKRDIEECLRSVDSFPVNVFPIYVDSTQ